MLRSDIYSTPGHRRRIHDIRLKSLASLSQSAHADLRLPLFQFRSAAVHLAEHAAGLVNQVTKSGLDVKALGLFALVMFPYTWKFLWSPLMDRFHFGKLGRRRSWMMLTQASLFIVIGAMGMLDPHTQVATIAIVASVVAFLSASQDIVIDAYRREIRPDN